MKRVDAAYVVGLEARALYKASRRIFENGEVEVTEWTNAAMGIPFIPARNMMGIALIVEK